MVSRFRVLLMAAPVVLLCVGAVPCVAANMQCYERGAALTRLKEATGEVPRQAGLASNGAVLEITVNAEGEWTAFFTYADGYTCPFASGEGWRGLPRHDDDPAA